MKEIYDSETTVVVQVPTAAVVASATAYQTVWDWERPPLVDLPAACTFTEDNASPLKSVTVSLPGTLQMAPFSIVVVTDLGNYTERFTRVVPYATVAQIASAAGVQTSDPSGANYRSEDDVKQIESLTRAVIESYTGQSFGKWYTSYDLPGTETQVLYSSQPVLSLTLIRTHDDVLYGPGLPDVNYAITPSGHGIEVFEETDIYYGFPDGYTYQIVGTFGYDDVPTDIVHAAILIASTYVCSPASYWNRYVEQTKFGESQTKFNRLAFTGTGNAAADIILQKYQFHNYFIL